MSRKNARTEEATETPAESLPDTPETPAQAPQPQLPANTTRTRRGNLVTAS